MENKEIQKPNFVLLKTNNKGPIYKVTICKSTLNVLEEKVLSEIPEDWSVQDYYNLLDEGKRFFGQSTDKSTSNVEVTLT
ncbi:hypothetical protein D7X33_19365 [Butyricicoccus sp. 1XD8-22]|nr:hypothetical protein D7X33_19365 [Butyricicoccus sp. 1XD8-22]